jgi:hypothetical protein
VTFAQWCATLLLLAVGAAGCRQALDLHERHDAPPDAGAALAVTAGKSGIRYAGGPACAACMDQSCAAAATACASDLDCLGSASCFLSCADGNGTCRSECNYNYRRSPDAMTLIACRAAHCSADCALSCGATSYISTDCESCIETSCCDPARTCASNDQCLELDTCTWGACLGGTCGTSCDQANPDGVAPLSELNKCIDGACASACRGGSSWDCVGSVLWPKPDRSRDLDVTLGLSDVLQGDPFVGVDVKLCARVDLTCAGPKATATSDATGKVNLRMPSGITGFDGYIDMSGGSLGDAGDAIFPSLWYFVPPYITGGWKGYLQFISMKSMDALAGVVQVNGHSVVLDPTRGHVAIDAMDCGFNAAPGVSISADTADGASVTFYFVNGLLPSASATETDAQTGIGGIVNLPAPNLTTITAKLGGETYGSIQVYVRPGVLTSVALPPTP